MGKIYDEFCSVLEKLEQEYIDDPDGELHELLLLALEREKLVSTAYRDSLLHRNITDLNLPEKFKTLFRHAFIWIWIDEEMHTTYTRGALLQAGKNKFNFKIYASQMAGFVGGWAGSVLQLSTWRKFPVSYTFAKLFTWLGTIGGKVPKEVRGELRSGSLKKFCAFNVDAEDTAWICWKRITTLIPLSKKYPNELNTDFYKIVFDEKRHGQIFKIIHDTLDEKDELIEDISFEQVVHQIREVSNYFLPKNIRELNAIPNPIGNEGKVWSIEDKEHKGKEGAFKSFIAQTNLEAKLLEKIQTSNKPLEEFKVIIKVSFTMGYDQKDVSPINDKALLEQLVQWIKGFGVQHILVSDVDTMYNNFFDRRDVKSMAEYYQFNSENYTLVNSSEDQIEHQYSRGIGIYKISESWKNADFRISFGKLKSHPIEMALLSIGNLEWLAGNCEDFIFLDKMSERPTTTMVLLDEFPPDYALLDVYENIPDGLIGVMGCKKPKSPKRFYGSSDALALDTVVMKHIGIEEFPKGSILKTVDYWFGKNYETIEVVGTDEKIKPWKGPTDNFLWAFLSLISNPIYLMFSQRGSLFIPKMDKLAFPEKKKPRFITRTFRNLNRRIIGLN